MLTIETARVFEPLLQPSRYKGIWGGRGSGKSHFMAGAVVEYCLLNPGARIVCIREVQKTLAQSAKLLIENKIQEFGVGHLFRVLYDRIETPGGGLIIFQGMTDQSAESIKSLENYTVAWVEEAQTLSNRSLALLRPTIRAEGSEIWFSWNPRRKSDAVDQFLRVERPSAICRTMGSTLMWSPVSASRTICAMRSSRSRSLPTRAWAPPPCASRRCDAFSLGSGSTRRPPKQVETRSATIMRRKTKRATLD